MAEEKSKDNIFVTGLKRVGRAFASIPLAIVDIPIYTFAMIPSSVYIANHIVHQPTPPEKRYKEPTVFSNAQSMVGAMVIAPFAMVYGLVYSFTNMFRNIADALSGKSIKFSSIRSGESPFTEKAIGAYNKIRFRPKKQPKPKTHILETEFNIDKNQIPELYESPKPIKTSLAEPVATQTFDFNSLNQMFSPNNPPQTTQNQPEIPDKSIPAAPALPDKLVPKSRAVESKPITAKVLTDAKEALKNKDITAAGSDDKSPENDKNHTKEQGQRKSQRNSGPVIPGN